VQVREWLELDLADREAGGGGYTDGRGWEGVRDELGNTPLHQAAHGGHSETVTSPAQSPTQFNSTACVCA